MTLKEKKVDFAGYYGRLVKKQGRHALWYVALALFFAALLGYYGNPVPAAILGGFCVLIIFLGYRHYTRKYQQRLALLAVPFPEPWQQFLEENAAFYNNLGEGEKQVFQKRVQFFLAEKKIEGISTEIDDGIRLLVAASAIIPTFAFPYFEYPNLRQVLVYPNSFDRSFQTERAEGSDQIIAGMVGNGFLNGTLLLSKADLVSGFKGNNPHNVGIHEFVHLLDMADGAVDGLPEIFLTNAYTLPWLQVIKAEVKKIKKGQSDINPYSLTNNAEFLAVVSEYFFDNPEKLEEAHPELYQFLCTIFQQEPGRDR
jgi:Mlc titration factor MtfA (ptsG expression regulator)